MITIYIKGLVNEILRMACLIIKVYIIDNLKASILIDTDILIL